MFSIAREKYIYIPIRYNIAMNDKDGHNFCKPAYLNEKELENLLKSCVEGYVYYWDFSNIFNIAEKSFCIVGEEVKHSNFEIVCCGLEVEAHCKKEIEYQLKQSGVEYEVTAEYIYIRRVKSRSDLKILNVEKLIREYLVDEMETSYTTFGEEYLVSSGIYSNMQINYKRMFYNPAATAFTVYVLSEKIRRLNLKFDYLVSTSKNGVALATILGEMLGTPIEYFNIGQMYEETYNCTPSIQKGKRYLHIFDVICVGSEAKVVNALIGAQGGEVVQSVGIICLLDLIAVSEKNNLSSMNKVTSILSQEDLEKTYKISLTKERGGDKYGRKY